MKKLIPTICALALLSLSALAVQQATSSFSVSWKFKGATQEESDQKLANYLAAYAKAKGRGDSTLCKLANGDCLKDAKGATVYDLALVTEAIEAIIQAEAEEANKTSAVQSAVEAARIKAEDDFNKGEKPDRKAAATKPPN